MKLYRPLIPPAALRRGRVPEMLALLVVASLACGITDAATPMALVAARTVQPDGTLRDDVAVFVLDGKIERLAAAADAKGDAVRRFGPDTVICPGLIDPLSSIGAVGQAAETAKFIDPDASAADALDPLHEGFASALRSGITAALVAPAPNNLVCGTGVVLRTFVDRGHLDVLRDDGPLVFAFGDGVWRSDRSPTSRAGTQNELRELMTAARQANAHPRINAAVAGQLDAMVVCPSRHDLGSVQSGFGDALHRFSIVHTADAIDAAAELQDLQKPMVVGPYGFASPRRVLLGAAALSRQGIEVAFRGGLPESAPQALRITAALAVRHGMDPAAARRAITIAAANAIGVADRIGAISPGKDADLVVFSGDPLRLDSIVLEVYVRGVRVYAAAHQNVAAAGGRP